MSSSDDGNVTECESELEWAPPYNPHKNLFVRGKSTFPQPSAFSLKKQRQFRKHKATHLHLVSQEWLSTKQAQELEDHFKFYRKKGAYSRDEIKIMKAELQAFIQKTGSKEEQLYDQLHKRKTAPLDLIIPVAEKLIWRDRTSVQRKLEKLCKHMSMPYLLNKIFHDKQTDPLRWDHGQDKTLVEVMTKPENKLKDGEKHSLKKWREITAQCKSSYPAKSVRQRW
ncbi:hypothetical protein VP01_2637g4 [Puccinia sorghi]|uniref:Uncharacterized protein n=1 Tax=Puccinia sorghi TaxID=27349 RepID=A0A0L6V4E0_9BASI|nr:hypothetical protein VP01_2637g4 [Puccinia sorghi]